MGPSSESPKSSFLLPIVVPGEVLDDLSAAVDFITYLMDGVGWLALGSGLSLADSIHTLVLQGEGEDSSDSLLVCQLLFATHTESVS